MSSKAECLKRYMSDPAGGKKKKKKKVTCTGPVHLTKTKIVDDDVDWREIAPELKSDDEEEFVADEEGQPQVVEVVDEQQIAAEKMKWKQIQEQRETMEERRDSDALSDDELPVKRRERHDSDESPPRRCGRKDSDESPPRRERLGSDSSPPRRRKAGKTQTSASERSRQDSDESPPRRRAKDESDESPPRRRNREDSDESPPRRRVRRDSDSSPPRRRRNSREVRGRRDEDDESPPRKRVKAEFDESPPRRERGTAIRSVSHEQRQHGQADTGRRKDRNDSSDFRSNIKEKNDSHEALLRRERKANYLDSRQSTSIGKVTGDSRVRRRHDSDDSPPRRLRRDEPDEEPLRRVRVKVEKSESGGEARHNATGSKIAGITEGRIGTKSGLQTAAVLREENRLTREKEKEVFEKMDGEMSGRGAETVFRDKQGRRIDPKLEKIKQRQAEEEQAREQEKYKKWGSGYVYIVMMRLVMRFDVMLVHMDNLAWSTNSIPPSPCHQIGRAHV